MLLIIYSLTDLPGFSAWASTSDRMRDTIRAFEMWLCPAEQKDKNPMSNARVPSSSWGFPLPLIHSDGL